MTKLINIKDFIKNKESITTIDVRSPGEFKQGHIPGAINIPLFNDEERAQVGICYVQQGHDEAVELGLELIGPKMGLFVKQAKKAAPDKKIQIYCFRGGMRSSSFAWLMETAGFKEVYRLQKGYKAFRHHVLDSFKLNYKLNILGGMTGSGKTYILKEMQKNGLQMLDLEGLANHKGSAFGSIGEKTQPSTEMFENIIADTLSKFDITKTIWVEDESKSVGKVRVPKEFYDKMQSSPLITIQIPREIRADHLSHDYAGHGNEVLKKSLEIISRKLGGLHTKQAIDAIESGEYQKAAEIILFYYDKSYNNCLSKKDPTKTFYIKINENNPAKTAVIIQKFAEEKGL